MLNRNTVKIEILSHSRDIALLKLVVERADVDPVRVALFKKKKKKTRKTTHRAPTKRKG